MPSSATAAAAAVNGVPPGGAAASGVEALKLAAIQKISQIKTPSPEVESLLQEFLQVVEEQVVCVVGGGSLRLGVLFSTVHA
jgi:hypothetical protein